MKIVCILGQTASGKTTIAKKLAKKADLNIIVTLTTRPIREGEVDQKDYHFIDDRLWDMLEEVLVCKFISKTQDQWKYGMHKNHLDSDCIVVIEPSGYRELKRLYGENVLGIYLDVDSDIRAKRYIERESNADRREARRRFEQDEKDFKGLENEVNHTIHTTTIEETMRGIYEIVQDFKNNKSNSTIS